MSIPGFLSLHCSLTSSQLLGVSSSLGVPLCGRNFDRIWECWMPAQLVVCSTQMSSQFIEINFTPNAFSYWLDSLKRYWAGRHCTVSAVDHYWSRGKYLCVCVDWSILMIVFSQFWLWLCSGFKQFKHQSNCFSSCKTKSQSPHLSQTQKILRN